MACEKRRLGMVRWTPATAALLAAALLTACAYRGGVEDPATRKLTWFSYLQGDDIRDACAAPVPSWELRLVYNGHWDRQVRTYDLVEDGAGGAYMTVRASPSDTGNIMNLQLGDLAAPWRWERQERRLDPQARAALESALAESGMETPPPRNLRLKSWGSYWVAIECRDGDVIFNAWAYPSERWDDLELREALAPHDIREIAFMEPQAPSPAEDPRGGLPRGRDARTSNHFEMVVRDNGLVGVGGLF